jgi:hypothetical protein
LSADGSSLLYSTRINSSEYGTGPTYGIAVDAAGNAYVTGNRLGATSVVPTTANAYQQTVAAGPSAFVTELNADGSGLVYSSYFRGVGSSYAYGIALDSGGHIYVTGSAANIPIRNGYQATMAGGGQDAFVAEFDPTQSGDASLVYSTYLGGSLGDQADGIAVDPAGNLYVTGSTSSLDFPTVNALRPVSHVGGGPWEAFLTQILANPTNINTNIVLTSSLNPAPLGQTVTFLATVSSQVAGAGTPSGTVTFYVNSQVIISSPLDAAGQATVAFTPPRVTTNSSFYYVQAIYSGTTGFAGRSSTIVDEVVTGTQATTTTLKASANPAVYGQSVTFSATVKGPSGSGYPTGTVRFFDGSTLLGIGSLYNGVATLADSILAPGIHAITAEYGGDPNFMASSSVALSETVKQASTQTTLASSLNRAPAGQTVTFTATVAPVSPGPGTGPPTGTITFVDGNTVLGTVALVNGKAALAISTLTPGKHTITGVYSGDVDFLASPEASFTETIQ